MTGTFNPTDNRAFAAAEFEGITCRPYTPPRFYVKGVGSFTDFAVYDARTHERVSDISKDLEATRKLCAELNAPPANPGLRVVEAVKAKLEGIDPEYDEDRFDAHTGTMIDDEVGE